MTVIRLKLNGEVVSSDDKWLYDWFEIESFSPRDVREMLDSNTDEELTLEVNSYGGNAFAGFEIYSLLRSAKCRTVAEVQSLAASAASTIVCACSVVRMSPVAQMMIHLPSVCTKGNQNEHKASIRYLDSVTEGIINGYELKSRGKATRAELENLVRRETWLSAREALDLGLADEIIGADAEPAPAIAPSAVYNSLDVPTAAELLARYNKAVIDGAPPAPGHPVEGAQFDKKRAQARLALEKIRYL